MASGKQHSLDQFLTHRSASFRDNSADISIQIQMMIILCQPIQHMFQTVKGWLLFTGLTCFWFLHMLWLVELILTDKMSLRNLQPTTF